MPFAITTVTAFICKDKNNEEGVIAIKLGPAWMPLIFADEQRAQSIYPMVKDHFPDHNYRIVQFYERKDVTEEWLERFGESVSSVDPDGTIGTV